MVGTFQKKFIQYLTRKDTLLSLLFPGLRNDWVEEKAHTSSSP